MLDLRVARRAGRLVLGEEPPARPLPGDLAALAADAEARISAYTGMVPAAPLPPPEGVSRGAWLEANLTSMGRMLQPVQERLERQSAGLPAPLRIAARAGANAVLAGEVGALAGWMGRRVLGQYDLALLDAAVEPRLLLVAPNLHEAAAQLRADPGELLAWVCVHETTHAVQFGAVPWLRGHLGGLLEELLASVDASGHRPEGGPSDDLRALLRSRDLRALRGSLRERGLAGVVAGPERLALLDRVQATMAVVEGHAEHVMDAVGEQVLPDLPALRRALDARRRRPRSALAKLVERLLGLELKLQQYEEGKAFCDAVVEQAGVAALHRVWEAPEALPTLAELRAPAAWLARTAA